MSYNGAYPPPLVSSKATPSQTRFPPSLEFFAEDREKSLRDASNVRRVEALFSVTCYVQPDQQGRGEWVTVGGGSACQASLDSAKVSRVVCVCVWCMFRG